MGRYLAERYRSAASEDLVTLVEQDRGAAAALAAAGVAITHLRTIYVPVDETCFSLFEAQCAEDVVRAAERVGFCFDPVCAALDAGPLLLGPQTAE